MKISEVLERAKIIISEPKAWTKHAFRRDKRGKKVDLNQPAACYCTLGAVHEATGHAVPEDELLCNRALSKLWFALTELHPGVPSVIDFNDAEATTHEQVMTLFDKAIQLAKEDENARLSAPD